MKSKPPEQVATLKAQAWGGRANWLVVPKPRLGKPRSLAAKEKEVTVTHISWDLLDRDDHLIDHGTETYNRKETDAYSVMNDFTDKMEALFEKRFGRCVVKAIWKARAARNIVHGNFAEYAIYCPDTLPVPQAAQDWHRRWSKTNSDVLDHFKMVHGYVSSKMTEAVEAWIDYGMGNHPLPGNIDTRRARGWRLGQVIELYTPRIRKRMEDETGYPYLFTYDDAANAMKSAGPLLYKAIALSLDIEDMFRHDHGYHELAEAGLL